MTEEILLVKVPIKDRQIPENQTISYTILKDDNKLNQITFNRTTKMVRALEVPESNTKELKTLTELREKFYRLRDEYKKKMDTSSPSLQEWKKKWNDAKTTYTTAENEYNAANDEWMNTGAVPSGTEYEKVSQKETNVKNAKNTFISVSKEAIEHIQNVYINLFEEEKNALIPVLDKIKELNQTPYLNDDIKNALQTHIHNMELYMNYQTDQYNKLKTQVVEMDPNKIINIYNKPEVSGGDANSITKMDENIDETAVAGGKTRIRHRDTKKGRNNKSKNRRPRRTMRKLRKSARK